MDEQQQELAAFESSIAGTEPTPAAATEPVAEVAREVAPEAATVAEEPTETPEPASEPPAAEDDPEVFEGFKKSEVKRLLTQAAEVEGLKQQLRKAHGKIGELNSRIQTAPSATPTPAQAPELSPELKQFEEDYPDVAKYVKSLGIVPVQPQATAPAVEHQPVAAGNDAPAASVDPLDIELVVMDRMHKGWREKVQSQEFGLWIASQGEQVQQAYETANTADGLSAVIGQYDQWAAARTAAADKAAKGQQRLKASLTPAGNAPRPMGALTEQQAFEAALKG
jgi:hypothetical protein